MLGELIREYITKDMILWVVAVEHIGLIAYFLYHMWKLKGASLSSNHHYDDAK